MSQNLRRTLVSVVALVLIGIGTAGLLLVGLLQSPARPTVSQPPQTVVSAVTVSPTPETSAPPMESASTPTTAQPLCDGVVGTPQRVIIEALGVDAAVEVLGPITPQAGIGAPADKAKVGWQPSWPGVMPGACKGTVLLDAHTYGDGSAVFKETYNGVPMSQLDKLGMVAIVVTDVGNFYYHIDYQAAMPAAEYPAFIKVNDIYDVDQSEAERVFFATCSDGGTTETLFTGYRIPPP